MIWGFIRSKQLVWSLNISTLYWEMMKIIKYKISIEHLQVNWIGLKWCRNLWGASNQGRIFTANESLVSELYFFGKFLVTLHVPNLAGPSSLSVLVRFSLQVKPLFLKLVFWHLDRNFVEKVSTESLKRRSKMTTVEERTAFAKLEALKEIRFVFATFCWPFRLQVNYGN